ncbi:MAG TPA: hypothetical protein VFV49_11690 [Thermoanaerobaculia bacterium]|nr:hypothetical protein [Thermoanaerobaculia bacterium]
MFRKTIAVAVCVSILSAVPLTIAQTNSATSFGVRQFTPPEYVFNPDLPRDLVGDFGSAGFQVYVDTMAWNAFIALNWPVPKKITERGVPDRLNVIGGWKLAGEGSSQAMPTGPTVWETFKDTGDIYRPNAEKPSSFDTPESIPGPCTPLMAGIEPHHRRTLDMSAKVSDVLREVRQAMTLEPLVDQNSQYVWYEVKVNRAYYDYVVDNQFYNRNKQEGAVISFPSSSNTTGRQPVVKVKAAWKILGEQGSKQPDDPKRFYSTYAFIYNSTNNTCQKKQVGLVGMHIAMKTGLLPQWMWATFEHVDNAPDQASVPPPAGSKFNFYNPACPSCPVNTPPNEGTMTPTQVVRLVPIDSNAASDNADFQTALRALRPDNVWQYYSLVNAQWGASTTPGSADLPKYLANTTLETYLQEAESVNGCINCHGTMASQTDLDFQLQLKANPGAATAAKKILEKFAKYK